jgi:hypothetical protein
MYLAQVLPDEKKTAPPILLENCQAFCSPFLLAHRSLLLSLLTQNIFIGSS